MPRKLIKTRWTLAEHRRLIRLAALSKSVKTIANEMRRTPKSFTQVAKRLDIPLRSGSGRKAKKIKKSAQRHGNWTAEEDKRLLEQGPERHGCLFRYPSIDQREAFATVSY